MSFPVGQHEQERLQALDNLRLVDTPRNPAFDSLCEEARRHFGVPICLVSLLTRDRQWLKAVQGLAVSETPRDVAFCNYTILQDEVFVVPDALTDDRFRTNPLVTGTPFIRFYAGAPLLYRNNIRLGAFCLIDTRPRSFSRGDRAELAVFAQRSVAQIVAREFALLPLGGEPGRT